MSQSPAKRRKLSPEPHLDATPSNQRYPSFASPTRSSIARVAPQILERRFASMEADAPPPRRPGALPRTPPGAAAAQESLFVTQSSQGASQQNTPSRPLRRSPRSARGGMASAPMRPSRSPLKAPPTPRAPDIFDEPPPDPVAPVDLGVANPFQKRSALRRSPPPEVAPEVPVVAPEAAPAPAPVVAQEPSSIIATPIPAPLPQTRTSQATEKQPAHSERGRHRVPEAEPEEPTLPPTPTQRGLADPVVTTPPTGIHNTPSKRLKRRTMHQSSPLKPRPSRPSSRFGSGEDEAEVEAEPANKRQRPDPPSRFTQPIDPDAEKKKKRNRMLAEIRQLEADIRLAERENERVRKATAAGKELKRPANADALVEMLARTMDKPPTFEEKPKYAPSILDNTHLFLPFSRPPRQKGRSVEEIIKTEDLPSVLPVEVADPLPFLSVFTPFKFTSSVMTLPPTPGAEVGEADILQLHSIVTSAPHCLFGSKLNITVNTRSGAVERCDIEYLDPAAERELGPWVRKRAQGGVLGRDINSIYWASQQWYEAALKRARFFCQMEGELGTPEGMDKARRRIRQEARRGRKSQPGVPVEPEEHFDDEEENGKWSPDQLRRYMGRESVVIEVEGTRLVVSWRMRFDWTGEAEQRIEAVLKAPRRWHDMDERKQLDKIPSIFSGLVTDRSPIVAARTVVVLLMGE